MQGESVVEFKNRKAEFQPEKQRLTRNRPLVLVLYKVLVYHEPHQSLFIM